MTTDTSEQSGPWMQYEGQPYSQGAADAKYRGLMADKAYTDAARGGDLDKARELTAFREMSQGRQFGVIPTMPSDGAGVAAQMGEREAAIYEAQLDTWSAHTHPSEESRFQMQRGLATREQMQHAKDSIRRAKGDPEFGRKVTTPGIGAREKEMWAAWHFCVHRCREVPDDYDWSKHAAT